MTLMIERFDDRSITSNISYITEAATADAADDEAAAADGDDDVSILLIHCSMNMQFSAKTFHEDG